MTAAAATAFPDHNRQTRPKRFGRVCISGTWTRVQGEHLLQNEDDPP